MDITEPWLRLALEHAPVAMVLVDRDGTIRLFNQRYCKFTNLSQEDLVGKTIDALLADGVISNSPTRDALRYKTPQSAPVIFGTNRKAFVQSQPVLDPVGAVQFVVTIAQDLDDVQHIERQLHRTDVLEEKYYQHLAQIRSALFFDPNHLAVDSKTVSLFIAAEKVAKTEVPVFLHGPRGIGKENVARYIHAHSNRSEKHFVHIYGNSILDGSSERELFGYEDSSGRHVDGLLDIVDGGTAYFDELTAIPLPIQARLLDLVHRGLLISATGQARQADIRLIVGSVLDVADLDHDARVNAEWSFVLGTFPIDLPPLREKKDDIIPLLNEFLESFNRQYGKHKKFAPDAYSRLLMYDWPGNIRELKNLVHRAVVISEGDTIELQDLFLGPKQQMVTQTIEQLPKQLNLKEKMEQLEADYMSQALKQCKSARSAAKCLGMDSSTFIRKRQAYVQKGLMK